MLAPVATSRKWIHAHGSILVTGALIALVSPVTFYALRRTMRNSHSCAL
jgi:hypothetical protein